jgi:hypothetical protein
MSLKRSLGRFGARVGGNQELIEGVLEGIDPALFAQIINSNTAFMSEVVSNIEFPNSSLDRQKVMKKRHEALGIFIRRDAPDLQVADARLIMPGWGDVDEDRPQRARNLFDNALEFRKATRHRGSSSRTSMETLNISPDNINPEWKK